MNGILQKVDKSHAVVSDFHAAQWCAKRDTVIYRLLPMGTTDL